jgi:hypothetical protein
MARGRVPRFYAARNRNGQTSHRDASFWELVGDFREVGIAAPCERVWSALQRCTATSVRIPEGSPIARLLGTQPRAGFEVLDSAPAHSLTLAGRHHFARYMLTFDLTDAAEAATHLRAQTCALFPGACGQVYRVLVIGTRAHTAATTHILRSVRRLSLAPA